MIRITRFARSAALLLTAAAASTISAQVNMAWSTVGNAGNAADPLTGGLYGSVGYEYRIGTYEVTNAQYAAFLNTVAASDPNGLYNNSMNSNAHGGITRSGSAGSFTYTVKSNMGNKPVNYVNWYDAARMSNWMTNGQGPGGTESGVYTFDGVNSISGVTRDLSNPNQVFIPTEDEWYKAAYHQPAAQGGDYDNYWLFATQSNTGPTFALATSSGNIANPGPNIANYLSGADWNEQNGNVTTVGSAGNTSFYGTFDMNGNVREWNETLIGDRRVMRGGDFDSYRVVFLRSSSRSGNTATAQSDDRGFRLAKPIPTPATAALLGFAGLAAARRRR